MCVEGSMERPAIGSGGDLGGRRADPLPDLVLEATTTATDQRTYENCTRRSWCMSADCPTVLTRKHPEYDAPVEHVNPTNFVMLPLPLPLLPRTLGGLLKVPQLASDCISTKAAATSFVVTDVVATTATSARTMARLPVHAAPSTGCSRQTARRSTASPQHISGYTKATVFRTDDDLDIIDATHKLLCVCGFYYGKLSMIDAKRKLRRAAFGTYLLRDSSDPNFLYSLSVKTKRGTTSVRISYSRGQFRLDCDEALVDAVPSFDCVLRLVEYYTRDDARADNGSGCVFLESSGRRDTPIELVQPYIETAPSLRAMCRKVVNRTVPDVERRRQLPISDDVRCFLAGYPYAM
ncbi:Cytokine-inducible SH2-containing protein [Lamellibrachia satsuma]|nr:Cytokine-inducible SH2-containing protein [Lamellibrachia satsuma]